MTDKPDWSSLNFDVLMDWCQEFLCYAYVEDDLSDVGITCKEVEDRINTALIELKRELDKMEMI